MKSIRGKLTRTSRLAIAVLLMASAGGPSGADSKQPEPAPSKNDSGVMRSSAAGFSVRHQTVVSASPAAVYDALTRGISQWWDAAHTYSGSASNLSLDDRPQGCFCESLPGGGGVAHMTVVFAAPGRSLRLVGGLGPLQREGVAGSMSWNLEPTESGTSLELTYNVAGTVEGGLEPWAAMVGNMLRGQFDRLAAYAGETEGE